MMNSHRPRPFYCLSLLILISAYLLDTTTATSSISERRAVVQDRWDQKRARERRSGWRYEPSEDEEDQQKHYVEGDDFDDFQDTPSGKMYFTSTPSSNDIPELKRYLPPSSASSSTSSSSQRLSSSGSKRSDRRYSSSFPEFDEYKPRIPGGSPKRYENANRRDDEEDYEEDGSYHHQRHNSGEQRVPTRSSSRRYKDYPPSPDQHEEDAPRFPLKYVPVEIPLTDSSSPFSSSPSSQTPLFDLSDKSVDGTQNSPPNRRRRNSRHRNPRLSNPFYTSPRFNEEPSEMNEHSFPGDFQSTDFSQPPEMGSGGLGYSRMYMSKKSGSPRREPIMEHSPESYGSLMAPDGMYPGSGFGSASSLSPSPKSLSRNPWGSSIESLPALFDPKPEFDKSLLDRFMGNSRNSYDSGSDSGPSEPDYDASDLSTTSPDSFHRMGSFRSLVPFSSGFRFGNIFGGSRSRSSHNPHSDHHHHNHKPSSSSSPSEDEDEEDSCDSNESSDSKRHFKFAHPAEPFDATTFSPDLTTSSSSTTTTFAPHSSSAGSNLIPTTSATKRDHKSILQMRKREVADEEQQYHDHKEEDDTLSFSIEKPNTSFI